MRALGIILDLLALFLFFTVPIALLAWAGA